MKQLKWVKRTAFYNIFVGASMIVMWLFFFITDQIPELETAPFEIATHLIAEFLTAILLVLSGVFIFLKSKKAKVFY